MNSIRTTASMVVLMLLAIPSVAQWGNRDFQEKGDVLGRDLGISPLSFFGHTGVFKEYTSGDPSSRANSDEIEMLGPLTNAIVNQDVQAFIGASLFRGAFQYLPRELNWQDRRDIVSTITAMKNRPTPIDYVLPPYYNKYLKWTERDSDPQRLTLDDIDRMRSDAVVEFAYAENGFPILRPNLWRTIINSPAIFEAMASSNALTYLTEDGLIPMYQLFSMIPSNIDLPQVTVYDANSSTISPGGASSMTTVSVYVTDQLSGPGGLQLFKNGSIIGSDYFDWPSTAHLYTSADIAQLGSLTDGEYSIRAIDQASNYASFSFRISTSTPSQNNKTSEQNPVDPSHPLPRDECLVAYASDVSGIASVNVTQTPGAITSTATFPCDQVFMSTSVAYGPFCEMQSGSSITVRPCTCGGICSFETDPTSDAVYEISICVASPQTSKCASTSASANQIRSSSMTILAQWDRKGGEQWAPYWITPSFGGEPAHDGTAWWRGQQGLGVGVGQAVSMNFTVINSTNQGTSLNEVFFRIILATGPSATVDFAGDPEFTLAGDGAQIAYGTVTVSQVYGQQYPIPGGSSSTTATAPFKGPTLAPANCTDDPWWLAAIKRLLRFSTSCKTITGSDVVLTSSGAISFHFQEPPGVTVDTTTLHIFRFDGVDWSSSQVTSQLVFKDTTTGVITATGSWIRGGLFAAMFAGQDSSAPITTLSFQGSTRSFLTDVFVATDAYVVLTATDPAVSGYASQLATTYYRLDPTTASPSFTAYTSSIPLPIGFHILEYRSVDWAGNYEPIKTSTFLVTAGTLFRASSRLSSRGSGLMGFFAYGVLLDVQSRAQEDLTVQISSPNASPLLSADNIGDIGLGLSQMSARFDVQGGTPTLAALALRSGNSIASTSSVQIAFGYNGEPSMRHAITTTHSTDTVGNRMDFYVWNPLAPSTSSIASMDVLALQASTTSSGGVFHVRPVGNPIGGVELIVSDGVTPGGGGVLRADAQTHSSRALKSDIRLLTPQERAVAAQDALTLKHSRFNYKSEPLGTPPHTGVMHEDAPASIRGPGGSVSLDARLLNLEVALQGTAQRLKRLRERMRRLETR